MLQEAQSGQNEYLNEISQAPSLVGRISDLQKEEAKLEAQGHRVLSIEQKFQRANMLKEYRSIYNSLCCDSHNNIRSLVDRHIEFDAEDFSLVFYKAYTPEDAAVYVGTNAEILVRSTETLHSKLDSPVLEKIAPYRAELDRLRGDAV